MYFGEIAYPGGVRRRIVTRHQLRRLDLHNRNTRNKKDLNLPRCRLKTGQRSFAYRGAACWNSLPKDLKEVVDGRIFKKRFVNMLLA